MSRITRTCRCGTVYQAKQADLARGWGKSCSKKCAARKRTAQLRSGNHMSAAGTVNRRAQNEEYTEDSDQSWDAHKIYTGTA